MADELGPKAFLELQNLIHKNPNGWIDMLIHYLLRALGTLSVPGASKTLVMGAWQTSVLASAQPATGESLAGSPKVTIYNGTNPIIGPTDMQPFYSPLWIANFQALSPEPTVAMVEASFFNAANHSMTKLSEVKLIT